MESAAASLRWRRELRLALETGGPGQGRGFAFTDVMNDESLTREPSSKNEATATRAARGRARRVG